MLYTTTVAPSTWELLIKLMKLPPLKNFGLVGGTNLSLRYGHRLSIDLDLFTDEAFNNDKILAEIEKTFLNIEIVDESENMLFLFVEGVKVDIVLVPFPNIAPFDIFEGIRLTSCPDVIAMKLNALARRGSKKDFWDLAEIFDYYSVEEILGFFKQKYASKDVMYILRSMIYFDDAEKQLDPDPLKNITWEQVKDKIRLVVKKYFDGL
ncbi:MAG: nucleotidyl transferase AbiEii/AbiGii toxin family protein [Emticicia sp.]|nr:nucleotidyl transferase AbiEii/AbiGii toxin family protein [Emticicia sp.]